MFGFDIGTYELKIAVYEAGKVRKLVSAEMPENLIKDGSITSYEAMADLIKHTLKANKLRGAKKASVILPADQVFFRRVTMPAMTVSQLGVNLPYEFRDYLTMDKSKYFYDYCVNSISKDEEGNPSEMDLTIASIAKDTIADYKNMFKRIGFKLAGAIPAECAYANVLRNYNPESTDEYCFLDLGYTATRLSIFTGTTFETSRSMDSGLFSIEEAIADQQSVDRHVAATYLVSNHEKVQESEAAHSVYSAISLETRKALNFYSFNNRESNLKDAYCCGGGVNIPDLLKSLNEALDFDLHPAGDLLPESVRELTDSDPGAYTLAIGAAMQAKEGK